MGVSSSTISRAAPSAAAGEGRWTEMMPGKEAQVLLVEATMEATERAFLVLPGAG